MESNRIITTKVYHSPCGPLLMGSFGEWLCLCDWIRPDSDRRRSVIDRVCRSLDSRLLDGTSPVIESARKQLDEYFSGRRTEFSIPLLLPGTDFQKQVWNCLVDIPYGETLTYRSIAQRIGRPKAVRATANAIGANAVSVIVPCHRVIGSDRSMTGYAGGLQAKIYLLEHEQSATPL